MNGIFHASANATKSRARIARAFARSAVSYDAHAALQREVADQLLRQLPPCEEFATVLDLGCGTGYCTQLLQQRLPNAGVLAFDLAEPMLKVTAARCHSSVPLVCGDAQALPLRDSSVDLVISSLTVQWCSDLAVLFGELQRVLRPGGHVLLTTLGPRTLQELRAAWRHVDAKRHSNEFSSADTWINAAKVAGLQGNVQTELRRRHCQSLRALADELKGLGANTVASEQSATTLPSAFKQASALFAQQREAAGIPVSWEILYLFLQKPE